MNSNGLLPPSTRYRALPIQLVEIDEGVLVVRGSTEIRIAGARAERTVLEIWSSASQTPLSIEELVSSYAAPDRESVRALVDKLIARRILVDADTLDIGVGGEAESALEIFYWNFGLSERRVESALNEQRFVVVGLNGISRQLVSALAAAGVSNVEVVDYVLFRNQRLFGAEAKPGLEQWSSSYPFPVPYDVWTRGDQNSAATCIVATCENGGTSAMLEWNRHCVENDIAFLPIVLRRLIGEVGPFVVPRETACYECLCARQNSHLRQYRMLRAAEAQSPHGQAISGSFPSMGSILGDIAALEIVKFYSGGIPYKVGQFIEVNLLATELSSHRVLRAPRCGTCAPTSTTSAFGLERADFVPGPQFFAGDTAPDYLGQSLAEKLDPPAVEI